MMVPGASGSVKRMTTNYLFNGNPVKDIHFDDDRVLFTANGIEYDTNIYAWTNAKASGLVTVME